MLPTLRRPTLGHGRVGSRFLVVVMVAALTIGCVADTTSGPGAAVATVGSGGVTASGPNPSNGPIAVIVAVGGERHRRPRPGPSSPPRNPRVSVPVLYYHRVQALPDDYATLTAARKERFTRYDIIPAAFAAQLDWLLANGYTTILPRDLTAHWDHGAPLPAKPVILTFDDGSHDWITNVLPMLQARGMVAEFYLTLDAIAHGNVTWKQARRLIAAGNGVGAHDVHHVQLAAIGGGHPDASPEAMAYEVGGARRTIGQNTGVYPDSMAYVGGGFDAAMIKAVRDAGYSSARSIMRGIATDPPERWKLPVVRIDAHDDVSDMLHGVMVPGLPIFTKRMGGVRDHTPY